MCDWQFQCQCCWRCRQVEPDELWEEFFEYVEDMPSYDEMINFDVWQEFRFNKYNC